ncbi:MAG TPA: IS110 family transposase [bacterium]|nr:IS110 family transposase [bacterium]
MKKDTIFVGLDVHKSSITVAIADREGEVRSLGAVANSPEAVAKLAKRLGPASRLSACYEAGPCGYGIARQLIQQGAATIVVAPSLIPRKPGDRVKNDRRDAVTLARLLRSGDLTPVWMPDEAHEALRDLSRARGTASVDVLRHRNQLGTFLLRLGIRPPTERYVWSKAHRAWLQVLHLPHTSQQVVLRDYLATIDQAEQRLANLEAELSLLASHTPYAPLIAALQALRGVDVLTAVTLVAELGDLRRFPSPRDLMGHTGLVPSEDSSGERRWRGHITKTGNAHVRHVLIQAAWHYRHPPGVWGALKKRQAGLPSAVLAISRISPAAPPSAVPSPRPSRQTASGRRGGHRARAGGVPLGYRAGHSGVRPALTESRHFEHGQRG